jgi:hypothetical protein
MRALESPLPDMPVGAPTLHHGENIIGVPLNCVLRIYPATDQFVNEYVFDSGIG